MTGNVNIKVTTNLLHGNGAVNQQCTSWGAWRMPSQAWWRYGGGDGTEAEFKCKVKVVSANFSGHSLRITGV